jgi:putative transposase
MDKIVEVNQAAIENHLGEMVRSTVEETLNAMLDAEADRLCNAERYEHTEARKDTRAGHYERTLQTQAGDNASKFGVNSVSWFSYFKQPV